MALQTLILFVLIETLSTYVTCANGGCSQKPFIALCFAYIHWGVYGVKLNDLVHLFTEKCKGTNRIVCAVKNSLVGTPLLVVDTRHFLLGDLRSVFGN